MAHSQSSKRDEAYRQYTQALETCFKDKDAGGLDWASSDPDALMAAMRKAEKSARDAYLKTMAEYHAEALDRIRSGPDGAGPSVQQEQELAHEQKRLEGRLESRPKLVDRKGVVKLEDELVKLRAERDLLNQSIQDLKSEFPDGYDLAALKAAAEAGGEAEKKQYVAAAELSRYENHVAELNTQIVEKTEAYLESLQAQVEAAIENITYDVFRSCSRTYQQLLEMREELGKKHDEFKAAKEQDDFDPDKFVDNKCFSDARLVLLDANRLLRNEAVLESAAMATAYGRGFDMRQVMKSKVTTTAYVDENGLEQVEFSCQMHNGNRGGWATDNLTLLNRDLDATVKMMNGQSVAAPEELGKLQRKAPRWLIYAACCPATMPLVAAGGLLYGVGNGVSALARMTGIPWLLGKMSLWAGEKMHRPTNAAEAMAQALNEPKKASSTSKAGSPDATGGLGHDGVHRKDASSSAATTGGIGSAPEDTHSDESPVPKPSPRGRLRQAMADISEKVVSGKLQFKLVKRSGRRVVMAQDQDHPGGPRALTAAEHYLYLSTRLKRAEQNSMFASDWTALRTAARKARSAALASVDATADKGRVQHAGLGAAPDVDEGLTAH